MPPIARLTDIGSAHGSFPETPTIEGSDDGFVNSLPIHRDGDAIESHGSPSPSPVHGRQLSGGSTNTFLNSKKIGIIGTPVSCGGFISTGSGDTFIN